MLLLFISGTISDLCYLQNANQLIRNKGIQNHCNQLLFIRENIMQIQMYVSYIQVIELLLRVFVVVVPWGLTKQLQILFRMN